MMTAEPVERKKWTQKNMELAVKAYKDDENLSYRQVSRMYDIPVESLRRRIIGTVEIDCRPGPSPVFSPDEEDKLCKYLIEMSDMGFGLTREDVMSLAYSVALKLNKDHPFKNGCAGRGWYECFKSRHPNLTLRSPQPLSYCRALCSNKDVIDDFFAKLGGLYGRLNLMSKPMQVYNVDETGLGIVHKPGKVVAELGRRNVYSITAAEKGKTHTVLSCVSASGFVLPPLMIYPRKRCIPDDMKVGSVPDTLFMVSDNGWINKNIYLKWFDHFLKYLPPARPVLLIQDGHSSHVSIELIELAKANNVHLCLPAHTTHLLQPLDVGVFKSFKTNFSKACHQYMMKHPGRCVTADKLAMLIGEVWPRSMTPLNIMSGFKKCGIYPFNPGEIKDRQLAPSKVIAITSKQDSSDQLAFNPQQQELFEKRFEEGYNIKDPDYMAWLRINHPDAVSSAPPSESSSCGVHLVSSISSESSVSSSINDLLVIPSKPPEESMKKRRNGINSKTVYLNDKLDDLKEKEREKQTELGEKEQRKVERERKRKEREEYKEMKKKEREEKKKERERKKKEREEKKAKKKKEKEVINKTMELLKDDYSKLTINSDDEAECPICGLQFYDSDEVWICCDTCETWLDAQCAKVDVENIPEKFYCFKCK